MFNDTDPQPFSTMSPTMSRMLGDLVQGFDLVARVQFMDAVRRLTSGHPDKPVLRHTRQLPDDFIEHFGVPDEGPWRRTSRAPSRPIV